MRGSGAPAVEGRTPRGSSSWSSGCPAEGGVACGVGGSEVGGIQPCAATGERGDVVDRVGPETPAQLTDVPVAVEDELPDAPPGRIVAALGRCAPKSVPPTLVCRRAVGTAALAGGDEAPATEARR